MMSLGNSSVNPILYGIYSSRLRKEYKRVLHEMLCKKGSERVSKKQDVWFRRKVIEVNPYNNV